MRVAVDAVVYGSKGRRQSMEGEVMMVVVVFQAYITSHSTATGPSV